jgi:hypothetical protein
MVNALLVFNKYPYFDGAQEAKMKELSQWFKEANKVKPILGYILTLKQDVITKTRQQSTFCKI